MSGRMYSHVMTATLSASVSISDNTATTLAFNSLGTGRSAYFDSTNHKCSPDKDGWYKVKLVVQVNGHASDTYLKTTLKVYKNTSTEVEQRLFDVAQAAGTITHTFEMETAPLYLTRDDTVWGQITIDGDNSGKKLLVHGATKTFISLYYY